MTKLWITIKQTEFYDAVEFLSRFWLSKETLMGLNRKNGPIVTLRNKYSCITREALTLGGFGELFFLQPDVSRKMDGNNLVFFPASLLVRMEAEIFFCFHFLVPTINLTQFLSNLKNSAYCSRSISSHLRWQHPIITCFTHSWELPNHVGLHVPVGWSSDLKMWPTEKEASYWLCEEWLHFRSELIIIF